MPIIIKEPTTLYSIKEASNIIGVSCEAIYAACMKGKIQYYRAGDRCCLISQDDIKRYQEDVSNRDKQARIKKDEKIASLREDIEERGYLKSILPFSECYIDNGNQRLIDYLVNNEVGPVDVNLTEREVYILTERARSLKPYSDISSGLNITPSRAQQIATKAVKKMFHCSRRRKWDKDYDAKLCEIEANKRYVRLVDSEKIVRNGSELYLDGDISQLNINSRAYNHLRRALIGTVSELTDKTYDDLLKIRNMGKGSIVNIIDALAEFCLSLKDTE